MAFSGPKLTRLKIVCRTLQHQAVALFRAVACYLCRAGFRQPVRNNMHSCWYELTTTLCALPHVVRGIRVRLRIRSVHDSMPTSKSWREIDTLLLTISVSTRSVLRRSHREPQASLRNNNNLEVHLFKTSTVICFT